MAALMLHVKNTFIDVVPADADACPAGARPRASSAPPGAAQTPTSPRPASSSEGTVVTADHAAPGSKMDRLRQCEASPTSDLDRSTSAGSAISSPRELSSRKETWCAVARGRNSSDPTEYAPSSRVGPHPPQPLCRPALWREAPGAGTWWKNSSASCPISGVRLATIQYAPFAVRIDLVGLQPAGQDEATTLHVDGRFLALRLIRDLAISVLGCTLVPTREDAQALDAYLMKWQLTDLRLCQALALVAAGDVGVAKLRETRIQAHWELEAALTASAAHACGGFADAQGAEAEVLRQSAAECHREGTRKPRKERTGRGRGEKHCVVMGAQQATTEQDRRKSRRDGRTQSARRLKATLESVCRRSGAAYAIFWTPDDSGVLSAGGSYVSAGHASLMASERGSQKSFLGVSCGATFGPGEGLPGRVYQTGDQELVSDVGSKAFDGFLHGAWARAFGIRTIAAICHDGGVLECGTTDVWATFPKMTIASQLGLQHQGC